MARSKRPRKIEVDPYSGYARRRRQNGSLEEWYWTIRCRTDHDLGEWALGWFSSRALAREAVRTWVADRTNKPRKYDGEPVMIDLIDDYIRHTERTVPKENTKRNKVYTASQLREFIEETKPRLLGRDFDSNRFEAYLKWLKRSGYSPQTVENALRGARTFLRWCERYNRLSDTPKAPTVEVPEVDRVLVSDEDLNAVIALAAEGDEPVRLPILLRLLRETGMRPSEAFALRQADISGRIVVVAQHEHDGYTPKNKQSKRKIPISPSLAGDLAELAADDSPFAVPAVKSVYHYWTYRLDKAIRDAGVADFTLGSFRRTRATELINARVPLPRYRRMMGHSAKTALEHYWQVPAAHLIETYDEVEEHRLGQVSKTQPEDGDHTDSESDHK